MVRATPSSTTAVGTVGLLCLVASSCGEKADGLVKHPVYGQVLINGEPAEGVRVRLHAVDSSNGGNGTSPVGVTNAEGVFELSTNGKKDGAVAGTYKVTFYWPEMNGPSPDRLRQRFTNPKTSQFEVTIEDGPTHLTPFHLEAPWLTSEKPVSSRKLDPNDRPQ